MQGNKFSGAPPGLNWVRRLDPRTKLCLLMASFVMVLLPESPQVVALATLVVLGHVTLARSWRALRPIRWLLAPLAIFSLGVWSFLAHGPTLLFWGVSRESLAFGAANFLKLATMMVAGLTLLATTPPEELFLGLVKLRLPYPGAFAFALALRWVPEVFATAMPGQRGPGGPGPELGAGQPPGPPETPPAPVGADFPSDPAAQPGHGLGLGGPGFPDESPAHLSPGYADGGPGLAGPDNGRAPPGRGHHPSPARLGPDSRLEGLMPIGVRSDNDCRGGPMCPPVRAHTQVRP